MDENISNVIIGRNPVIELLKSGRDVDKIFINRGEHEGSIKLIIAEAKKKNIPILEVEKAKLNSLSEGASHQGVAAIAADITYADVDDLISNAESKGEKPLIIIADGIEDPHNLGAVIRTAECAGAHGLIIPKRHSAGVTQVVSKAAAGALEYLPVAKVPNLTQTVNYLKEKGLWIFAAETGGEDYLKCDYNVPMALVLGGEGKGISRFLGENCDYTVTVPIYGKINSLNVSNAAAVILYEIVNQRRK